MEWADWSIDLGLPPFAFPSYLIRNKSPSYGAVQMPPTTQIDQKHNTQAEKPELCVVVNCVNCCVVVDCRLHNTKHSVSYFCLGVDVLCCGMHDYGAVQVPPLIGLQTKNTAQKPKGLIVCCVGL